MLVLGARAAGLVSEHGSGRAAIGLDQKTRSWCLRARERAPE